MRPDKRLKRQTKKKEKLERLLELGRRSQARQEEQQRQSFPRFDEIRVLSVGEGSKPGFARNLALSYLARGVSGRVVAVDTRPADYQLPENMSHVTGDAIEFLKSLPSNSVHRVHDHFTAHYIEFPQHGIQSQGTLAFSYAKSGTIFAQNAVERKRKMGAARLKNYFSEIRRVLRPGGKLVLVNDTMNARIWEKPIRLAGLRIRRSSVISEEQAARLGAANKNRIIAPGEKLYAIIAAKFSS